MRWGWGECCRLIRTRRASRSWRWHGSDDERLGGMKNPVGDVLDPDAHGGMATAMESKQGGREGKSDTWLRDADDDCVSSPTHWDERLGWISAARLPCKAGSAAAKYPRNTTPRVRIDQDRTVWRRARVEDFVWRRARAEGFARRGDDRRGDARSQVQLGQMVGGPCPRGGGLFSGAAGGHPGSENGTRMPR